MKSKISFFNKTIFKKNIMLYWPIWAGYLLILLCTQPILLWGSFQNGRYYEAYSATEKLYDLMAVYEYSILGWLTVFVAIITGMALYSYIYNAKSANMIHALPVDKTQLFGTNVLSGLTILFVPQIVAAIASAGVCLGYGVNRLDIIGIALVESLATAFVAYAIVTFCAMFTGLLVALPIYVLVLNYLATWVYYMIFLVVNLFAYGVYGLGNNVQRIFTVFLAPISALGGYIGFNEIYENEVAVGLEIYAGKLLAVYVVLAIVLYVVAYFTYKKRHIEKAGEWITEEWLKPIFRFGAGMTAGIYGGILIRVLLDQIGIQLEGVLFLVLMVLLGGIGYFLAEMIIRKNFHVFQKKNWIRCGIFSVILLACYGGMLGVADNTEKYIPKKEEIVSATVNLGYNIEMDGEKTEQMLKIHETIIEYLDLIEAADEEHVSSSDYVYVRLEYSLKNGDYIDRNYCLYGVNDEITAIINDLALLENDPETFLKSNLCKRYDEVSVFGDAHMEVQLLNSSANLGVTDPIDYVYETLVFTPEQAKELYEAAIADVRSGALIKYNSNSYWMYKGDKDYGVANLYLQFQNPDDVENGTIVLSENSADMMIEDTMEYPHMDSVYLSIGKDCENVINKLIELGSIKSVDDIYWGE